MFKGVESSCMQTINSQWYIELYNKRDFKYRVLEQMFEGLLNIQFKDSMFQKGTKEVNQCKHKIKYEN